MRWTWSINTKVFNLIFLGICVLQNLMFNKNLYNIYIKVDHKIASKYWATKVIFVIRFQINVKLIDMIFVIIVFNPTMNFVILIVIKNYQMWHNIKLDTVVSIDHVYIYMNQTIILVIEIVGYCRSS